MMYTTQNYFWNWGPWMSPGLGLGIFGVGLAILLIVALIALKGYALWVAAKRDEKWWFIALLIVNTVGILELVYLIFVSKKWWYKNDTRAM